MAEKGIRRVSASKELVLAMLTEGQCVAAATVRHGLPSDAEIVDAGMDEDVIYILVSSASFEQAPAGVAIKDIGIRYGTQGKAGTQ